MAQTDLASYLKTYPATDFKSFLSDRGGYLTFSNTSAKQFTLGLDTILSIFRDIKANLGSFSPQTVYNEDKWRSLSQYYTDPAAKATATVQSKPLFSTLSKVEKWANQPGLDNVNTDNRMTLTVASIDQTITELDALADAFKPAVKTSGSKAIPVPAPLNYKKFVTDAADANLKFSESLALKFISSLATKQFVILTGLSGSGKTKLAQAFAHWISESRDQVCIVPVGADWTSREPLLGYPNALEADSYIKPENGVVDLLIRASSAGNESKPYFLILDEMNLSHVERYFADFLSCMESGETMPLHPHSDTWSGDVPDSIGLPPNLFVIGTVNVDETTYMFSPKVLDRANVIEFRITTDEMRDFLKNPAKADLSSLHTKGAGMAADLVDRAVSPAKAYKDAGDMNARILAFFTELKKAGAEFGYRTAAEINRFAGITAGIEPGWDQFTITDAAVMQKLLPRLHGSRRKLEPVLSILAGLCLDKPDEAAGYLSDPEKPAGADVKLPVSLEKIRRMYINAVQDGFTGFAEA
jgi:5-methylcytosine-specific restriction protein B